MANNAYQESPSLVGDVSHHDHCTGCISPTEPQHPIARKLRREHNFTRLQPRGFRQHNNNTVKKKILFLQLDLTKRALVISGNLLRQSFFSLFTVPTGVSTCVFHCSTDILSRVAGDQCRWRLTGFSPFRRCLAPHLSWALSRKEPCSCPVWSRDKLSGRDGR